MNRALAALPRWGMAIALGGMVVSSCQCEPEGLVERKPPDISVDRASVDFGNIPLGYTAVRTLNISNGGEEELVIEQVRITGADSFAVGNAPARIKAGESGGLQLGFNPLAAGMVNATVTLVNNDPDSREKVIPLTGVGVEPVTCGPCNSPPPAQCLSTTQALVYDPAGTCTNNECRYQATVVPCADFCAQDLGRCHEVADAGPAVDAGNTDAGQPDAGGRPDAGACDPDGTFVVQGPAITYSCCLGLASVNVTSLTLSSNGATVSGSPSLPIMSGPAAMCPGGMVDAVFVESGGCTEQYEVEATLTNANTLTGAVKLTFTGGDCGCFGGTLGTACTSTTINFTATR